MFKGGRVAKREERVTKREREGERERERFSMVVLVGVVVVVVVVVVAVAAIEFSIVSLLVCALFGCVSWMSCFLSEIPISIMLSLLSVVARSFC